MVCYWEHCDWATGFTTLPLLNVCVPTYMCVPVYVCLQTLKTRVYLQIDPSTVTGCCAILLSLHICELACMCNMSDKTMERRIQSQPSSRIMQHKLTCTFWFTLLSCPSFTNLLSSDKFSYFIKQQNKQLGFLTVSYHAAWLDLSNSNKNHRHGKFDKACCFP